jgi:hypothetical protein
VILLAIVVGTILTIAFFTALLMWLPSVIRRTIERRRRK